MPLHLDSITNDSQNPDLLAWLLEHELQAAESVLASADKQYLHLARNICDINAGDTIGKFVFTLLQNRQKKALEILDLDIVLFSGRPVPLRFLNRLEQSSDANEYYEVETLAESHHLEVETVNRHAIAGGLAGTTQPVFASAFPFALSIYDDMTAFNEFAGFSKGIKVGKTGYTVDGYAENFAATGSAFGAKDGETFSFLLGRVDSYREVSIQLGTHRLDFVIAQLETALGRLPTAMSREVFDLSNLSTGKIIAMRADIKVDFAIKP